jgi:hypothetical protein|tara:strand:+ start:17215 stop:17592 length:378 start_codon:yes stop_codon:yes gene_type:complete
MPRPKKKQINFKHESVIALMQEIYNECVEQRNTAIRIQNKMLGFMQGPEDLQLLGPVIKEQQKIIDSAIEKKIQLSKLQATLLTKNLDGSAPTGSLSLDDKETLNALLNKNKQESEDSDSTEYKM